jgi:hypothetical protein
MTSSGGGVSQVKPRNRLVFTGRISIHQRRQARHRIAAGVGEEDPEIREAGSRPPPELRKVLEVGAEVFSPGDSLRSPWFPPPTPVLPAT